MDLNVGPTPKFVHFPYEFPELTRITREDGFRQYETPEGNRYPSVTTILGSGKNEGLDAWRKRVGEEAAKRKSTYAANRGTMVHAIFEDFLNNEFDKAKYNPIQLQLFNKSKKYLLDNLTGIHNIEVPLYSDRLKAAGTCDLLCEWQGKKAILDYKTSEKYKRLEWITNYLYQETTYAMMVYERIALQIPQIVTFIVTEEEMVPQIIVEPTEKYIRPVIKLMKEYHNANQEC